MPSEAQVWAVWCYGPDALGGPYVAAVFASERLAVEWSERERFRAQKRSHVSFSVQVYRVYAELPPLR